MAEQAAFSVGTEVMLADSMRLVVAKVATRRAHDGVRDSPIGSDMERKSVKPDVTVGTKAQEVVRGVGTVVRCAEWRDVCGLRVWSRNRGQPGTTELACPIVYLFYPLGEEQVASDTRAMRGTSRRLLSARGWLRCDRRRLIDLNECKTPDSVSVEPRFRPIVGDLEEAVVSVSG